MIIRDHDQELFEARKELLNDIQEKLTQRHGDCISIEVKDQYRNMKEKIEPLYHIVEIAEQAMLELGIQPYNQTHSWGHRWFTT